MRCRLALFWACGLVAVVVMAAGGVADAGQSLLYSPPYGTPSVSCPSAGLCVAVDDVGDVLSTTNPAGSFSGWHATPLIGAAATSLQNLNPDGRIESGEISCASTTFCVVADSFDVYVSTDPTGGPSAWSESATGSADAITSIACPSSDLCVATNDQGVLTSTDVSSGTPHWQQTALNIGAGEVACASTALCVVVGPYGQAASVDPGSGSWTITPQLAYTLGMHTAAIACPTTALCIGVGDHSTSCTSSGGRKYGAVTTCPASGAIATYSNPADGLSNPTVTDLDPKLSGDAPMTITCTTAAAVNCIANDGLHTWESIAPTLDAQAWNRASPVEPNQFACVPDDFCLEAESQASSLPSYGPNLSISTNPFDAGSLWTAEGVPSSRQTTYAQRLTSELRPTPANTNEGPGGKVPTHFRQEFDAPLGGRLTIAWYGTPVHRRRTLFARGDVELSDPYIPAEMTLDITAAGRKFAQPHQTLTIIGRYVPSHGAAITDTLHTNIAQALGFVDPSLSLGRY